MAKREKSLDLGFLGQSILVLVANFFYLRDSFLPFHDSKEAYLRFHYFFSHLLAYGELPYWMPFGQYGVDAGFHQNAFTPANWLALALGRLVEFQNTLLLWKMSVLLEEVWFVLGVYLLAGKLFSNKVVQHAVTATSLLSTIWYAQIHFNFHFFYLIPLWLYFLFSFFEKPEWKSWAFFLVTFLFSFIGATAYFIPVWALIVLVLMGARWSEIKGKVRVLAPNSPTKVIIWSGSLVFLFIHFKVIFASLQGISLLDEFRGATGFAKKLEGYLTYGLSDAPPRGAELFLHAWPTLQDFTLYIGWVPLLFGGYAAVAKKTRWVYVFFAFTALFYFWSQGGLVALVLYFLPGMSYYRHLYHLLVLSKFFLIWIAGFGLERWLEEKDVGRLKKQLIWAGALVFLFFELTYPSFVRAILYGNTELLNTYRIGEKFIFFWPGEWKLVLYELAIKIIAFGGILFLVTRKSFWAKPDFKKVAKAVLVVGALELAFFQVEAALSIPREKFNHSMRPAKLEYISSRTKEVIDERVPLEQDLRGVLKPAAFYVFYYNVLGIDLCVPKDRIDYFPTGVEDLIRLRGGKPTKWPSAEFLPAKDLGLERALGCGSPKVRIERQYRLFSSDEEVAKTLREDPSSISKALISMGNGELLPSHLLEGKGFSGKIENQSFSANKVEFKISNLDSPGWFIYADSWSSNWQVYVNGVQKNLAKADLAFKAVFVDAGESAVVFKYIPSGINYLRHLLGLIGFCFALWLCSLTIATGFKK